MTDQDYAAILDRLFPDGAPWEAGRNSRGEPTFSNRDGMFGFSMVAVAALLQEIHRLQPMAVEQNQFAIDSGYMFGASQAIAKMNHLLEQMEDSLEAAESGDFPLRDPACGPHIEGALSWLATQEPERMRELLRAQNNRRAIREAYEAAVKGAPNA